MNNSETTMDLQKTAETNEMIRLISKEILKTLLVKATVAVAMAVVTHAIEKKMNNK